MAWSLIRERTKAGELIFAQYAKNNINRDLEFALVKFGFQDGRKYTSKSLRRGATQELLETGQAIQIVKNSGAWVGGGFRNYIDLEFDKTLNAPRMIISLEGNSPS